MDRIELTRVMDEIKHRGLPGQFFQKAHFRRCCHTLKFRKAMLTLSLEEERFHLTYRYPNISEQDRLTKKLRAELSNYRLRDLFLLEGDRVIEMDFGEKSLVIDLIKKNVGIKENDNYTWSLHNRWAQPMPLSFDESLPAGKMLGKALGGKYVNDLLGLLKVKKDDHVSEEEAKKALSYFLEKAKPYWRGKEYRLSLTPLEGWQEEETLSKAVDMALTKPPEDLRALERWQKSVEAVKRSVEERRKQAEELKRKGDSIYAHYIEVEDIISLAREGKWEELKGKYRVKGINLKEKWVEVELDEA